MSHRCDGCGTVVYRRIFSREQNKDLGVECGCTSRPRVLADSTTSAFDYTLNHVHDEFGKPLRVHSIKELSAAEKRLGFQSVVLNKDAQNFDDAPQQPRVDMARVHNWRYSSEQRFREGRR